MIDPRKTFETEAVLSSGGISFKNSKQVLDALLGYFGEGAHLFVNLWLWEKKRSTASNRYYFGVIVRRIAEQQGMEVLDVHEGLKIRLLNKPLMYVHPDTGEIIDEVVIGGQTHTMTQKQFNDYVRSAELFAMEFFQLDFTSGERDEFYRSLGPKADVATAQSIEAAQKVAGQAAGEAEEPSGIDNRS